MESNSDQIYLRSVENLLKEELKKSTFPGAVLGIVNDNKILYQKAFGYSQLEEEKKEMQKNTLFDLASLTKVVATTSSIMKLIEQGKINLWDYLYEYFPELTGAKKDITIYHLLTHTSGYQAVIQLWDNVKSYKEKIKYILNLPLQNKVGEVVNYSDPNFILLGELVRRVTDKNLDEYSQEKIFSPLKMKKTGFKPLDNFDISKKEIAATEYCNWREKMIMGEVHDKNAYYLGGISGQAGLFSDINDLSKFAMMLLNYGTLNNKNVFSELTVKKMISNWTENKKENRALGWDLRNNFRSSGGILLSDQAFGHTGFTGTSIWIDPELNIGIILLTNRVHPSRENVDIISLRPRLHNVIVSTLNKEGLI